MSHLKLYENVVIGNFLYGLGSAVQAKSKLNTVFSSINLLQQTPADQELADVLIEFSGLIRIIEFKRFNNTSDKEPLKRQQLEAALESRKYLIPISRSVHWFIETNPEKKSFVSRIVPYLDAYPRDKYRHDLATFIAETASKAVCEQAEFDPVKLREYLTFLKACQGTGRSGTGGLILAVRSNGDLRFGQLSDMSQLRLLHREFIDEEINNEEKKYNKISIQNEQELEEKKEQQITRKIKPRGPSL